jgi:hypothetical protein
VAAYIKLGTPNTEQRVRVAPATSSNGPTITQSLLPAWVSEPPRESWRPGCCTDHRPVILRPMRRRQWRAVLVAVGACCLLGLLVISSASLAAGSAIVVHVRQGRQDRVLFVAYSCELPVSTSEHKFACPAVMRLSSHPEVPLTMPGQAELRLSREAHIQDVYASSIGHAARQVHVSFLQTDPLHARLSLGRANRRFKVTVRLTFDNHGISGEEWATFVVLPNVRHSPKG